MSGDHDDGNRKVAQSRLFYGWIIVAIGTILFAANSSVNNSFGVFFKPLAADFDWSRANTSMAQSLCFITNGIFAIATGWLADRFGPSRVLATCGILAGSGLILTSRIDALWQIYLTYGLMTGIGLSSTSIIAMATTARWFVKRRGLALGIVSCGNGLGSFAIVPALASLIASLGWSRTYFIMGLAICSIIVVASLLLRNPKGTGAPLRRGERTSTEPADTIRKTDQNNLQGGITLSIAGRTPTLWVLVIIFFLFAFCGQMVVTHLVNYATDLGVAPVIAATLVSGVGLGSIAGRLSMGAASDRIGSIGALILCGIGFVTSLTWLIFARELWMLYLFTLVFGFAYGGEIPQQTALVGKFFGIRTVLVGIIHAGAAVGGAAGVWVGGQIFDVTGSYKLAFSIGIAAIVCTVIMALMLKKARTTFPYSNRASKSL